MRQRKEQGSVLNAQTGRVNKLNTPVTRTSKRRAVREDRVSELRITQKGACIEYMHRDGDGEVWQTSAKLTLYLIGIAYNRGCDFEDIADGFGEGLGTMGDWSGIRDSSPDAIALMLERSLNFLFGDDA